MDIDPDIGVCHPQGAVEAGHQQGQEGQTDTAHQLSPGDQGQTGQEIHSLQGGERGRVSEERSCSGLSCSEYHKAMSSPSVQAKSLKNKPQM